jgi:hypothetical protein
MYGRLDSLNQRSRPLAMRDDRLYSMRLRSGSERLRAAQNATEWQQRSREDAEW